MHGPGRSLLYFHHAGGLPSVPRGVRAAAAAAGLDQVVAVRFERAAPASTWATIEMLAAMSVRAVAGSLAGSLLYGHSMGGLVAFEVCRQLSAVGATMPAALVLGATAPPGVLPSTTDTCRRLGLRPGDNPTDDRVRIGIDRARHYAPRPVPLELAVHAICGRDDTIVSPDAMTRWSEMGCVSLAVHAIDGAHLFHQSEHDPFSKVIVDVVRNA
ncbi:thioesterase II family protein [Curtobacterium luteum]|uniref:thioesterase II family protein n=1 Tax=Curtobacterium luteum TaxID=33881 RepID=UPI0037FBEAA3